MESKEGRVVIAYRIVNRGGVESRGRGVESGV